MVQKVPEPECRGENCAKDRFAKNMQETRRALWESSNILKSVTSVLEHAARQLEESSDTPFDDLERRP